MNWRRWGTIVVGSLLAGWVLVVAALYLGQRRLVFQPQFPARTPTVGRLIEEDVGGAHVVMSWISAPIGAPTVVHFHGNGEQIADVDRLLSGLSAAGLGAAAVEYPGYGLCPGSPSQDGMFAAADAAIHVLREAGVSEIVLEGQSLGTGVATEMAARGYGSRLALISPFTSMTDMARARYPFAPAFLLRDPLDSASRAAEIGVPVLIVHGTDDGVVPYSMGEALSRDFPDARLRTIAGGGHNDLFSRDAGLLDALVAFARGGV